MRSLGRLMALAGATAALSVGTFSNPVTSRFSGLGPIILGGGSGSMGLDEEARRRRNGKAGGRDKRIKDNKARRSRPMARRVRSSRLPRLSNPFTKQARKDAFEAALKAGETRNMAAKLARRVSA